MLDASQFFDTVGKSPAKLRVRPVGDLVIGHLSRVPVLDYLLHRPELVLVLLLLER